jgi:hypothetical protein
MGEEKQKDWMSFQLKNTTKEKLEVYRENSSDSTNDIIERLIHIIEKQQLELQLLKSRQ